MGKDDIGGQFVIQPASPEDLQRDAIGYTNKYLHRRIEEPIPNPSHGEVAQRQYNIVKIALNSHRFVESFLHDEDSETSEIP